jgi:hypothetical protein
MAIARRTLSIIGATLTAIVSGGFALHAVLMIQREGMLATYHNYKGALMHYSGFLVTTGAAVACALGALAYAAWHRWRLRREINKLRRADSPPA